MHKVEIRGVNVVAIDVEGLHEQIESSISKRDRNVFAYVNIHAMNIASSNEHFKRFLNSCHITYCDGEGVRLGARILGKQLPKRIVLTYWIWELCKFCEQNGYSIFLLGGPEGAASEAARTIKGRFPGVRIAGTHHGYFRKEGNENKDVIDLVNSAKPEILIVGFGMPLQEYWIESNLEKLNVHVVLPAGSTIDYAAGRKGYAPKWMANHGMEWLYRLFEEPKRLWRRYLIGNPFFIIQVILTRLQGR